MRLASTGDMSVISPMRKPRRMPLFTHELTFHLPDSSRSAARTRPRLSAFLKSLKTARSFSVNLVLSCATSSSIHSRSMCAPLHQPKCAEHFTHTLAALLLNGNEWETKVLFKQTQRGKRSLHRPRTRLDEVHFHQWQQTIVQLTRTLPIPVE